MMNAITRHHTPHFLLGKLDNIVRDADAAFTWPLISRAALSRHDNFQPSPAATHEILPPYAILMIAVVYSRLLSDDF